MPPRPPPAPPPTTAAIIICQPITAVIMATRKRLVLIAVDDCSVGYGVLLLFPIHTHTHTHTHTRRVMIGGGSVFSFPNDLILFFYLISSDGIGHSGSCLLIGCWPNG